MINLLRRRDIRSVPVVTTANSSASLPIGTFAKAAPAYPLFRDEDEIRHYTEQLTVTAAMTADPMTIALDAPLVEAAKILETYRISCLPVVDEQRLVGALTVTDLLGVFANGTRTQAFAGEAEVRFETFNPACDRRVSTR